MKKSKIEQITTSFILLAISALTILPFLFRTTPTLVDEEKEFKTLLQNLTNNVEFHYEKNILPALFFSVLLYDDEVYNFYSSNQIFVNSPHLIFLRLIPAIFSTLVTPIFFNFLCSEGATLRTAFAISLLISLDSTYIIRSRLFLPDCFIYFFSVGSLYFFSKAIKWSSSPYFIISAFFASITFLCDHQGIYIISFIFFRLVEFVLEDKITFKKFFIGFCYLFVSIIFSIFFVAIIHIGLQTGPSDIQPLSKRFLSEMEDMISLSHDFESMYNSNFSLSSKLTYPKITNHMKIQPNYVMLFILCTGIFSSIKMKRPNLIFHFFISFISSFFYSGSIVNHMQMMIIFGLISTVPFFDKILKRHSKNFTYFIMASSLILYLLSFQSNYGGELDFPISKHEL